jgi:hypothetical protein
MFFVRFLPVPFLTRDLVPVFNRATVGITKDKMGEDALAKIQVVLLCFVVPLLYSN